MKQCRGGYVIRHNRVSGFVTRNNKIPLKNILLPCKCFVTLLAAFMYIATCVALVDDAFCRITNAKTRHTGVVNPRGHYRNKKVMRTASYSVCCGYIYSALLYDLLMSISNSFVNNDRVNRRLHCYPKWHRQSFESFY